MPTASVGPISFDTGAGSQTLNTEVGPLDLSYPDVLKWILKVTKAAEDAGDTLNVYIQSRGRDGVWHDRVSFTQILGSASPAAATPEILEAVLQKMGSFSDDEEESEPSGSTGASRLTTGTVRNGPFPGKYYENGARASAWRVQAVIVDADNDADFEFEVYCEYDEVQ